MADVHHEHHRAGRTGWLRAAVLGANDGIVSTASLIVGVAAGGASNSGILLAGTAAVAAGAMSMAAGEFVSVSSQSDTERADLQQEYRELKNNPEREQDELAGIYVKRGLDKNLAAEVAKQLMEHDALGAHARDEIGITDTMSARPLQAAAASAITFVAGGALPLIAILLATRAALIPVVVVASLLFLGLLGGVAARAGGASIGRGVARVLIWGAAAMGVTAVIGSAFGVAA